MGDFKKMAIPLAIMATAFLAPQLMPALGGIGGAGAAGAGGAAAGGAAGAGGLAGMGAVGTSGGLAAGLGGAAAAGGAAGLGGLSGMGPVGIAPAVGAGAATTGGLLGKAKSLAPYALLSVGSSSLAADRQKKALEEARMANEAMYNQYSLPNQSALNAQATQNRGEAGQARLGAYQNLSSNLAARGFGSGSGLGVQAAGGIESNFLKSLGQQATELTKFGNTRQFAPPGSAYSTPVSGGLETALGKTSSLMDMALGYSMMNRLIGGQ